MQPPITPITPIPVEAAGRDLILVGGTFDPPHRAHARLPELARRAMGLSDAVLMYVPAAASPFKVGTPAGAPASDRLEMLRLAIADLPGSAIWTDEIDRTEAQLRGRTEPSAANPAPGYWIDTLRRLRESVGEQRKLWFVIGTDQAAMFHRWKSFEQVLAQAEPIVLPREPITTAAQLERALRDTGAWSQAQSREWASRLAAVEIMPERATDIRARLEGGLGPGSPACTDLDPRVARYIQEHHLYRGDRSGA